MGGQRKLLSGETALWWPSGTSAETKPGGQASDLGRSYHFLGTSLHATKHGYLLVTIRSNAVMGLPVALPCVYDKEKECESLVPGWLDCLDWAVKGTEKGVFPAYNLLCRPEFPCESPLPHATGLWGQVELPMREWNSVLIRKISWNIDHTTLSSTTLVSQIYS